MAALTANVDRKRSGLDNTLVGSAGVAASTTIYKHSLVSLDGGVLTTVKSTSPNCVGYSKKKYDNSSGAASAISGEYYYNDLVELTGTGVTAGSINKTVYAVDDNVVQDNPTGGVAAGLLKKLDGNTCTVLVGVFDD